MIFLQTKVPIDPQEFFTPGSFTTLLGATAIVYIVCGVVQNVFNFSPKWFALALSIIVSFIGAFIVTKPAAGEKEITEGIRYLIAFLNGFLIYSSAVGSNQLFNRDNRAPSAPGPMSSSRRSFNTNWWN